MKHFLRIHNKIFPIINAYHYYYLEDLGSTIRHKIKWKYVASWLWKQHCHFMQVSRLIKIKTNWQSNHLNILSELKKMVGQSIELKKQPMKY